MTQAVGINIRSSQPLLQPPESFCLCPQMLRQKVDGVFDDMLRQSSEPYSQGKSIRRLRMASPNFLCRFGGSEQHFLTCCVDSEAPNGIFQLVVSIRRLRMVFLICVEHSEPPNRPKKIFFPIMRLRIDFSKLFRSIRRLRMAFTKLLGRFRGSEWLLQNCQVDSEAPNGFRKTVRSIRRLRMVFPNLLCRFGGSEWEGKNFLINFDALKRGKIFF